MHPDERNMADSITRLECANPNELFDAFFTVAPRNIAMFLMSDGLMVPQTKVTCLNPHFFAYGQLSLYIGAVLALLIRFITSLDSVSQGGVSLLGGVGFQEAVLGLRLWSALASILLPFVMLRTLVRLHPLFQKPLPKTFSLIVFIFSPVLIQFSHFGTTEAVIMLWYALLVDLSIALIMQNKRTRTYISLLIVVSALAIATKISSLMFLAVPVSALCLVMLRALPRLSLPSKADIQLDIPTHEDTIPETKQEMHLPGGEELRNTLWHHAMAIETLRYTGTLVRWTLMSLLMLIAFVGFSLLLSLVFSPHNILSLSALLGSMRYESDVGLGQYIAFYTRQFLLESPLTFQFRHIFPYVLGNGVLTLTLVGLVFAPWKKKVNMVRFALLAMLFVTGAWYAKWTRFLAPMYPLMLVLAMYTFVLLYTHTLSHLKNTLFKKVLAGVALLYLIIPGIAFLSVYTQQDVRFVASDWVYKHIPSGSLVLSETANVIDIPIPDVKDMSYKIPENYSLKYISFPSYDVDTDPKLQDDFLQFQKTAEYVFVPSRRVFYNHTCVDLKGNITTQRHTRAKCEYLARTYPVLTKYYQDLFSGKLGFRKVAEFSSYPRITLFGKTILQFPDEEAEETFTVFDHPVVRIYKKSK